MNLNFKTLQKLKLSYTSQADAAQTASKTLYTSNVSCLSKNISDKESLSIQPLKPTIGQAKKTRINYLNPFQFNTLGPRLGICSFTIEVLTNSQVFISQCRFNEHNNLLTQFEEYIRYLG